MNQFILGGGDPVLAGTQIDEQIQLLEGQKQLLMARQRQMQQGAIVQQQQQLGQQPQVAQVSLWDSIDAEVEPLTNEQRQLLLSNEEYVNNYNALQNMVQVEVLNLVRAKIENSEEGRNLLTTQLKLVKSLKTGIVEKTQRDMELFNAFKEASKTNPSLTYDAFINSLTMVQLDKVKIKIQEYILSQIDSLGATNPAIKLVKPLAKRAIVNNMDGIDKWLRKIADADGNIDIDGIVTEEIEIINSIDNYDFTIPLIGDGNISRGNVTLSIPFINKGIVFNQSDLETFRQLLIQE